MRTTIVKPVEKTWLSNKEAQRYLGVGMDFFKRLRATGQLPFSKVGSTVFYRKADIDRLLERSRVT